MEFGDTEDKNFVEMRKSKRIDYYSEIFCIKSMYNGETEEYSEPLELKLINVSAEGLGVISGRLFENGSVLVLRIKLEDVFYDKVTARVIWSIKSGDVYRHGLEISNLSGKLYRHLSRLDNSIITSA